MISLFTGVSIASARAKNCNRTKCQKINDCAIRLARMTGSNSTIITIGNECHSSFTSTLSAFYARQNPTRKTHRRMRISGMKRLW